MNAAWLLEHFDRISEAPDAVARLRRFILDLAVRGKLVEQDPKEAPGSVLFKEIAEQKLALGLRHQEAPLQPEEIPFKLPHGWSWGRIGEVCSKTGSGSTPRGGREVYRGSGIPFLRSQNVYDDGLKLDNVAYIDAATHLRMAGTAVAPGDLLLNITGGSIGRCCRVPGEFGEANVSQHVAIVRPAVTAMAGFLHLVIRAPYFQRFIFDEQTGAGRGGLPKNRMDRIAVAIPPLAEQHRIVAKVDELMALCDQLEASRKEREARRDQLVMASLARLNTPDPDPATFTEHARFALETLPALTTRPDQIKQLRQTILNLAVRGKLVPQNSNEKPLEIDDASCWGELPSNWRYIRLIRLLAEDTRNGYSRRPDDAPDGTPILRISAGTVRGDGVVAEEEHKLIGGINDQIRHQYGLKTGDLLACRFNGNKAFVGRLSIFRDYSEIQPIYPDKLIRVRVDTQLALPEYMRLAGDSDIVRRDVEGACATTVGNWGISASNLKNVRFPLPPLAEQHRIVAKVDELMALCDHLESSLATSTDAHRRLLEATLREALEPAMEEAA